MRILRNIFEQNRQWADSIKQADPGFFSRLAKHQSPYILWIGCADSRVPANQITNLPPGDLFVHRNIANLVVHTDLNCLSVIQYAVEVLKVKHIVVCGHYGCGGVKASMEETDHGLIDNWLRHIRDVQRFHSATLMPLNPDERFDRLCELNIREQVVNVCNTTIVKKAWENGYQLTVHGWIYSISNGLLTNLDLCVTGPHEIPEH